MTAPELEKRVATRVAAAYIGTTPKHVIRLIKADVLDGRDVRLPGASRPTWAVTLSSIRRFLAGCANENGLNGPSEAAGAKNDGVASDTGR